MQRKNYSYQPHERVTMQGCATCKYSRSHLAYRSLEDIINSKKCKGASVIDLGDGTVKVVSNCSGLFNIYPKEMIVLSNIRKEK